MAVKCQTTAEKRSSQGNTLLYGVVILLLLIAMAAVVGIKLQKIPLKSQEVDTSKLHQCQLQLGPCVINYHQQTIRLEITPRPVKTMTTLQTLLTLDGLKPSKATILFKGISMDMGENSFLLQGDRHGNLSGEVMLPVCLSQEMLWQVWLVVELSEGVLEFPFLLQTTNL